MPRSVLSQRKRPSFVLPPSLTSSTSSLRPQNPYIAAELAKTYHALACGMKHTAKRKLTKAVTHVEEARERLVQVYKEGQAHVDRARKIMEIADSVYETARTDEEEARYYLEFEEDKSNFIAAKYHATSLGKKHAAEVTRREANAEFEKMRNELERTLREGQKELDAAREAKAIADFELKNATQEVVHSRSFLTQLSMNDDASIATECFETDKADVVKTFEGHEDHVCAIAAMDDDKFVTGSKDKTAKYWSKSAGGCIRTYKGHGAQINSVAVVSDRMFVTASNDKSLKLWDVCAVACVRTFVGHTDRVQCVAAGSGVEGFISGSFDKTVKWWQLSGACLRTFKGHSAPVYSVATLGKDRVVSAGIDKAIRLWNTQTGRSVKKFRGHSSEIYCVTAIDKDRFVSCSRDNTARLWDSSTAKTIRKLKLGDLVGGADFSVPAAVASVGTEQRFVAVASGCSLRLWNLWSDVCSRTLEGHGGDILSVASIGENGFLSASSDKTVKLWDLGAADDDDDEQL